MGGGGNDTLSGGTGSDSIGGGAGNDRILQGVIRGGDTIDGGSGTDTVDYGAGDETVVGVVFVSVDLAHSSVKIFQDGSAVGNDRVDNIEDVIGTGNGDTISGNNSANHLSTQHGADTLSGAGGSDALDGGGGDDLILQDNFIGNDVFDGGAGFDTVDYSLDHGFGSSIDANLASGIVHKHWRIFISASSRDTLREIEGLKGTLLNDRMTGSGDAESLNGNAGNDALDGAGGDDTLAGGAAYRHSERFHVRDGLLSGGDADLVTVGVLPVSMASLIG